MIKTKSQPKNWRKVKLEEVVEEKHEGYVLPPDTRVRLITRVFCSILESGAMTRLTLGDLRNRKKKLIEISVEIVDSIAKEC